MILRNIYSESFLLGAPAQNTCCYKIIMNPKTNYDIVWAPFKKFDKLTVCVWLIENYIVKFFYKVDIR